MDNTHVADQFATPCPTCGARCFAALDLDSSQRCNVCRKLKTATSDSFNVRRGRPSLIGPTPEETERRTNQAMTANEARHNLRIALQHFLPNLIADLSSMKPFMRWTILQKLMKYHLPTFTQKTDEDENTGEKKIVLEVHYVDGDADIDVNQATPHVQIIGDNNYGMNDGDVHVFTPHIELPSTDDDD